MRPRLSARGIVSPALPDEELLRIALSEERVILTCDKDFGELAFRQLLPDKGVILLRFRVPSEAERVALLERHWPIIERSVPGHFVVVTNYRIRRSPLPSLGAEGSKAGG